MFDLLLTGGEGNKEEREKSKRGEKNSYKTSGVHIYIYTLNHTLQEYSLRDYPLYMRGSSLGLRILSMERSEISNGVLLRRRLVITDCVR